MKTPIEILDAVKLYSMPRGIAIKKLNEYITSVRLEEIEKAKEWCSGDFGCDYYELINREKELQSNGQ